jgi:hypothetical protein
MQPITITTVLIYEAQTMSMLDNIKFQHGLNFFCATVSTSRGYA